MRFRTVLFDLDGTVVDSGAIILASMRHAARTVLRREVADGQLLEYVGGSGLTEQMRMLDPDRVDELVRCYREHNEPLHRGLRCCDGMPEVLRRLRDGGRRLGLVTAKRHATVLLAFDVIPGLSDSFDVVVASDDTERHKPHPEPILAALDRLAESASAAAYVGDSPFDIRAAKAAGVAAVGVTWGGIHPRERLVAEEPDALVYSPEELLGVL